jgi:hypothetical protein
VVPEPPSRSPYYRPIAPRGGIDELMSLQTPGYRSSWLSGVHATPAHHSLQPLSSSPSRTGVWVLASGEADVERIEVEAVELPMETSGDKSGSLRGVSVPASRKASFKQVVLGAATGERNSSFVGVEPGSQASAVVDAAHAMTELCRQTSSSVPPSVAHPASAFYLQMKHPHPSIAPSIPSGRIEGHKPASKLPSVAVESDFENKKHPIVALTERDILLGRGGQANHHAGNRWFRNVISCYRMHYCVLVKGDKMQMARNLATWFYLSGARFLLHDDKGCWYEAGATRASKKCSQSLREGACTVVRKTLEGSMLVGADAAVGVGPGGPGSQSNTVTPTLQLEERDASSKSVRTSDCQSSGSVPASKLLANYGERTGSTAEGRNGGGRLSTSGAGRSPKRSNEGESKGVAKKWENWRKRARESTG